MNNPYKAPMSELIESSSTERKDTKRKMILMILANIYYWPKLLQYIVGFKELVFEVKNDAAGLAELGNYSVGLPVYISCALLIFNLPLGSRIIWQILITIAIVNEAYHIIDIWNLDDLVFLIPVVIFLLPLYLMGAIYAFWSKGLWAKQGRP